MSSPFFEFDTFLLSWETFDTFPFFASTWTAGTKSLPVIALVDPTSVSPLGRTGETFASSTLRVSAILQGSSFSYGELCGSSPLTPALVGTVISTKGCLEGMLFDLVITFSYFFGVTLTSSFSM